MNDRHPITSASNPIEVDFLESEDHGLPGRIGITIAPGKRTPDGKWARDLDRDLSVLRTQYGTDRLVSLIEPFEYRLLHIVALPARARAASIAQTRFAIRDVDIPRPTQRNAYIALIRGIVGNLRDGETVVIHCRGGVGRSGTVATSILNARGHTPAQAVRRVRDARVPYAVSRKQLGWVSDLDHSYGADVEDPAIVARSTAEDGALATRPGWGPPWERETRVRGLRIRTDGDWAQGRLGDW